MHPVSGDQSCERVGIRVRALVAARIALKKQEHSKTLDNGVDESYETTMPVILQQRRLVTAYPRPAFTRFITGVLIGILLAVSPQPARAQQETQAGDPAGPPLYMRLQLSKPAVGKDVKPGDVLQGQLTRDVYSQERQIFAETNAIELTVDQVLSRRRVPNDHWPWVIKVFLPRHEKYPTFSSALVNASDGRQVPLHVQLVSVGNKVEVSAAKKEGKGGAEESRKKLGPTVVLTAELVSSPPENENPGSPVSTEAITLPSGTAARLVLLGDVSAGESRAGDPISARLIEPIRVNNGVVVPEGAVFNGKVARSTPPKMLSRAGSLFLSFTSVDIPGRAEPMSVEGVVSQVERDQRSQTTIDAEGDMHGGHAGKAWLLANIGVTAGAAKVTDDTVQLAIEAVISSATDASTAGTAQIVAACVSGVFLLTRHGRDVVLPRYDELEVTLSRPAKVPAWSTAAFSKGSH